jgi:chromosome segregation ATPase
MISELENKLKESSAKIETMEREKNNATVDLKKEIERINENIQQKENEIVGLKSELQKSVSEKYIELESLKEEKEAKEKEIKELKQKLVSLEETIGEAKGAPQLIESIKDIMLTKGFLSDREFDAILEKKEI